MFRAIQTILPFACLLAADNAACDEAVIARPNVLFLAVDDLRPELGCYGSDAVISPNIDRLASRGMTFERAYCQQAVCNPSRASVMTGLRPDTIRVWDLVTDFRTTAPDAVTIPQYFRQHGYYAVSYGKIFHNTFPDQASWDEPHRWPENSRLWSENAKRRLASCREQMREAGEPKAAIQRLRGPAVEVVDMPDGEHIDGAIADQAIRSMGRLAAQQSPFFLAVGFIRPHLPFVVPRTYWDLYDRSRISLAENSRFPSDMPDLAFGDRSMGGFYELRDYMDYRDAPSPFDGSLTEMQQRELKHGYYAAISMIDAQIGRVLDELQRLQLLDNTVIALWGDHGWKLGEHNGWCKQTNFEVDTRAPLIVCSPDGRGKGLSSNSLVEFVDIYPTLCDLAGLPIPAFAEGVSLSPILSDAKSEVKDAAFSQFRRNHRGRELMGYAMRTPRYRVVDWLDRETGQSVAVELYDHQNDASENANVANRLESREVLAGLLERLHTMIPTPLPKQPHRETQRPALTIENHRAQPVFVFWVSPDGKRLPRGQIAPGESMRSKTTLGHEFIVQNADGQNAVRIIAKKDRQVTLVN